jgi:membrane protein required for colicin V production
MIDALILIGLLIYMVLGFRDGFFKKIFGVLGFWGGLICATKFFPLAGGMIISWLDLSKETAFILAFFLIFLLVSLVLNLFYRWFGRSSSNTIKISSRMTGLAMGCVQGAVAISLFLLMLNIFDLPSEENKNSSYLYKPLLKVAPTVFDYSTSWMPESKAFLEELKTSFGQLHISE